MGPAADLQVWHGMHAGHSRTGGSAGHRGSSGSSRATPPQRLIWQQPGNTTTEAHLAAAGQHHSVTLLCATHAAAAAAADKRLVHHHVPQLAACACAWCSYRTASTAGQQGRAGGTCPRHLLLPAGQHYVPWLLQHYVPWLLQPRPANLNTCSSSQHPPASPTSTELQTPLAHYGVVAVRHLEDGVVDACRLGRRLHLLPSGSLPVARGEVCWSRGGRKCSGQLPVHLCT